MPPLPLELGLAPSRIRIVIVGVSARRLHQAAGELEADLFADGVHGGRVKHRSGRARAFDFIAILRVKIPRLGVAWRIALRAMRKLTIAGACVSTLIACASSQENPTPAETPPEQKKDAPVESAHAKAVAEVARLKAEADANVMTAPWTGPHDGVPPFDKVKAELFSPAFTTALALLKAEVNAIAENPEAATFDNTIGAMENAGRHELKQSAT